MALFPFKRLGHSFVVSAHQRFEVERERRSNQNVRLILERLKERVMNFVDMSNPDAIRKAEHYIRALNAQLQECDRTDEFITLMDESPAARLPQRP